MTKKKQELLKRLKELEKHSQYDPETAHMNADKALLEYINDVTVTTAFNEINKWYE